MKAAIIYLAQKKRLNLLNKSLDLLEANFNKKFNYPVVIFHENEFSLREQTEIIKGRNISFLPIEFEIPSFLDKKKIKNNWENHSIGWRHMCRFFSCSIYEILKEYDYYMRLDDDSFILSEIDYDIFNYMKNEQIEYAYRVKTLEHEKCVKNIDSFLIEYINKNNIRPKFLFENFHKKKWNRIGYYNNFHITKISFWLREDVSKFLKAVDLTGGFYFHRWGDLIIQTLATQIFMEKNKIHQFLNFDYEHKSNLGNNTFFGGFFGKNGRGNHCDRTFQNLLKNHMEKNKNVKFI